MQPNAEERDRALIQAGSSSLYDVGVAGLHRLLAVSEQLAAADMVRACHRRADLGGLRRIVCQYDGSARDVNFCSPNVSAVNIDNGFGAAYTAVLIARASSRTL